jgi:cysteine desulfurase
VAAVVLDAMTATFGNANSVHHIFGEEAASLVSQARTEVAALVGAAEEDVHFTSGASDSIRLAVTHAIKSSLARVIPCRVVASSVEHRALLDVLREFEASKAARVELIPVDERARLDLASLGAACARGVDLVCVMAANNEVGTVYPIAEVVRIAAEHGAATLIDATQAAGRVPLRTTELGVTYLTLSAHKMYGPKGVGALVTPRRDVRSPHGPTPGVGVGTPNVPGIAGFGAACRLRRIEMHDDEPRIATLRDSLERCLCQALPDIRVNGDRENRLSHNLHVSVPGVPNDAVVARLRRTVAISTGAACTSGAQAPSHVLRAMGLPRALQEGALRIGLGRFTTETDLDFAAERIVQAIRSTRAAMER